MNVDSSSTKFHNPRLASCVIGFGCLLSALLLSLNVNSFLIQVFFHEHSLFTGQQGKGVCYLFNSSLSFYLHFTDTQTLAGRLLRRAYLSTQPPAGFEPEIFGSERKSLTTKLQCMTLTGFLQSTAFRYSNISTFFS